MMGKCFECDQSLEEDDEHCCIEQCVRALVKRVEKLEMELLAKRLTEEFHNSSVPPIDK